jgi:hypothetical protein
LERYRQTHPDCFVIVPHPNHGHKSLGLTKLKKYRHLFDAVEHSWYYLASFNPNLKVKALAKQLGLPFIATADLHLLKNFNEDYAILEVEELTVPAVFESIRQGKFTNVTRPKTLVEAMEFFWRLALG